MSNCVNRSAYYITTAIPYVNAEPHVGFALELIQTDVLARYHRQRGRDVRFLSGTDDNSLKNVRAAEKANLPVAEFVRQNADAFYSLRECLQLSYDDFIRTSSDPRHEPGVHKLWRACDEAGDIYKSSYSGRYCVGCESYYTDAELVDGRCVVHRRTAEFIDEENYFFRLRKYGDRLLQLITSGELAIEPARFRNEVVRFIQQGLEDFSISRSTERARGWGVSVPEDASQVIYVWFDALGNYITALDYAEDGALFQRYWRSGERTHVIGKGITRFHAVYWIAILLSAGLPLPTRINVHGYLTVNGRKIGKSEGNGISPRVLVECYGVDAVRHYLLRHMRSTRDGDFSVERLVDAHNSELADKLGNLASRTTTLIRRYRDGVIPSAGSLTESERALIANGEALDLQVCEALQSFRIHDATAAIWAFIDEANRYVVSNAPWHLAKDDSEGSATRFKTVLYTSLESLRLVGHHLRPFLPKASARLLDELGGQAQHSTEATWGGLRAGTRLPENGAVLFPKRERPEETGDERRCLVAPR